MSTLKDYLNLLYLNFNIFLSFTILYIQAFHINKDKYDTYVIYL